MLTPIAIGLTPDLDTLTATSVYLVVFALVFVESGLLFGFFLPGDTVLFAAGLLTARPDSGLSWPLLAAGVFVAAVVGDSVGYTTGSQLGRPWLVARVEGGRLEARQFARAEAFYTRCGWLPSWQPAGSRGCARSRRCSPASPAWAIRGSCQPTWWVR